MFSLLSESVPLRVGQARCEEILGVGAALTYSEYSDRSSSHGETGAGMHDVRPTRILLRRVHSWRESREGRDVFGDCSIPCTKRDVPGDL